MSKPQKGYKIVIKATEEKWLVEASQDVAMTFEEMDEKGLKIGSIRFDGQNYAWQIEEVDVDDDGV
jgi:hypothetical protein